MISSTTYHVAQCDTCKEKFGIAPATLQQLHAELKAKKWSYLAPNVICPVCYRKYEVIAPMVEQFAILREMQESEVPQ